MVEKDRPAGCTVPLCGGKHRPWVEAGALEAKGLMWRRGGSTLRNVMRLSEQIIFDHNIYAVIWVSQSKPETGVFFSDNSYFKCYLTLYIFFEGLFIIHHIFTEFLCAWVYDWILGL